MLDVAVLIDTVGTSASGMFGIVAEFCSILLGRLVSASSAGSGGPVSLTSPSVCAAALVFFRLGLADFLRSCVARAWACSNSGWPSAAARRGEQGSATKTASSSPRRAGRRFSALSYSAGVFADETECRAWDFLNDGRFEGNLRDLIAREISN